MNDEESATDWRTGKYGAHYRSVRPVDMFVNVERQAKKSGSNQVRRWRRQLLSGFLCKVRKLKVVK